MKEATFIMPLFLFTYDISINLLNIYILGNYGFSIVIYESEPEIDTILTKAILKRNPTLFVQRLYHVPFNS